MYRSKRRGGLSAIPSRGRRRGTGIRRRYPGARGRLRSGYRTKQSNSATGDGGYKIGSNTLILGMDPPVMRTVMKGEAFRVRHREYVQDINSSSTSGAAGSAFGLDSFKIQPANPDLFPWLSQIAVNYQEYRIRGMVFEFKSLQTDAIATSGTSPALGTIIMATNYNSAAPNFPNKLQMLETEYSADHKPSVSFLHPIECKRNLTPVTNLYVRVGALPANEDERLYDFANFQIATQGIQANNVLCGELWCSYDIEFFKPILQTESPGLQLTDHFQMTGLKGSTPLGTAATLQSGSTIQGSINIADQIYTFPIGITGGQFMFVWSDVGVSVGQTAFIPSVTSGSTINALWNSDNDTSAYAPQNTASGTKAMQAFIVQITMASVLPVVVTFGVAGAVPTSGSGDLWVTAINPGIIS